MVLPTRNEINMLEITYRLCVEYMQKIHKKDKTNICLLVTSHVWSHHYEQWSVSMSNDLACKRFLSVHNSSNEPLLLWSTTLRFQHKLCELSFLGHLL